MPRSLTSLCAASSLPYLCRGNLRAPQSLGRLWDGRKCSLLTMFWGWSGYQHKAGQPCAVLCSSHTKGGRKRAVAILKVSTTLADTGIICSPVRVLPWGGCSLRMSPSLPCMQQTSTCWLFFVGMRQDIQGCVFFQGSPAVRRDVSHYSKSEMATLTWNHHDYESTLIRPRSEEFPLGFGEKPEHIHVHVTWYNLTTTPVSAGA